MEARMEGYEAFQVQLTHSPPVTQVQNKCFTFAKSL